MTDDLSYAVVITTDAGTKKYWTGRMEGRWPEYLSNPDRAVKLPKQRAQRIAAEFNTAVESKWAAEPIRSLQ